MSAAVQAFADFSAPVTTSRAVGRFLSLPRWGSAPTNFMFDMDYFRQSALTALIPIIAGVLLTLLTLIHIIIRHTCRAVGTSKRQERIAQSKGYSIFQTIFSAILFIGLTTFISLGLLGNAALSFSADDALTVIQGLVSDLSRLGFAFLDTALLMENRIRAFNLASVPLPQSLQTSLGDQLTPTFGALQTYALAGFPDIRPLRIELDVLVTEIDDVLNVIQKITNIVYGVILGIIIILALSPPLLLLSDSLSRRAKRGSRIPHFLFLIVLLLGWLLIGVAQTSGIIISDVCVALHDYREALITQSSPSNNVFLDSGFTCPSPELAGTIETRINDTAEGVTQSELATDTVEIMLEETSQRLQDAARWSGGQARRLVDCSTQIEFSGKLEFIVCGSEGSSAVEGVYDLFTSFLGLVVTLHLAIFVGLFGLEIAGFLGVWKGKAVVVKDDESFGEKDHDVVA